MSKTRLITISAFLASVSIVMTRFASIIIPLGGFPALSIDLGSIPIMIAGIILGPLFGGIVGFVADITGFIINNRGGVFHFGFTLNAILTGVIPGIIFKYFRIKNLTKLKIILISLLYALSVYYFLIVRQADPLFNKIMLLTLVTAVSVILVLLEFKIKNNLLKLVIFTSLFVEIFVFIALTPIWLYQLYQLPYFISVLSRVFRGILLVPIKAIITYQVLKILQN